MNKLNSPWELTLHTYITPGLKITAGQRTMPGQKRGLTGQSISLPVILTGHFLNWAICA
jgi:hypothetical protein